MGRLTLPTSGMVYVDAQIVIYSTDNHPAYATICAPLWQVIAPAVIVSSELTLLETLVAPIRSGNTQLALKRESLWIQPNTRLLPITQEILKDAARLRATMPSLKTPDSIHAATALYHSCTLFITNDRGFRNVPGLPLMMLDDVLMS